MTKETLKEKTVKGLFWGGLSNGVQQAIGVAFGILLGRLLTPDDYGMIAMITIFTAIANTLQNSGFSTAIANLKNPRHEDYNSVFWFNVIVGSLCYVVLFFSAPLIARYYHEPRLVPLCRFAFLSFWVSSLGIAQSAYLFKNLKAKQLAKAGMTAVLISSTVGAIMAWQGMSYWSLATQSLVYVAVCALLVWHYSDWRPTCDIDFGPVRRMFGFSSKVLATNIMSQVNLNILNILLGRYFSAHSTGCYNQANQWNSKCAYLVQSMIAQVAQPVLVDLKDQHERQLLVLRKMMRFTAFITFPLLFGLGLVSHEFIVTALTAKWAASADLLRILSISGATIPPCILLSNLVLSKGRSGIYFWITFTLGLAEIATMLIIWPLGIRTMVIAYTAINVVWMFVWHETVRRMTGYSHVMFLRDIVPFALAAFAVMAATYWITLPVTNMATLLAVRVAVAPVLYYVVMKVVRVHILAECEQFVRTKLRKKQK